MSTVKIQLTKVLRSFYAYSFELQAINQQEVDLCMSAFTDLQVHVQYHDNMCRLHPQMRTGKIREGKEWEGSKELMV